MPTRDLAAEASAIVNNGTPQQAIVFLTGHLRDATRARLASREPHLVSGS